MVNRLSADMLYPPCPTCETNVMTVKRSGKFVCLWCEQTYTAGKSSKWWGVEELTDIERRDYIAVDIREYQVKHWARLSSRTEVAVQKAVQRARNRIQDTKREHKEEVEA